MNGHVSNAEDEFAPGAGIHDLINRAGIFEPRRADMTGVLIPAGWVSMPQTDSLWLKRAKFI
jgi:hypothetical protein